MWVPTGKKRRKKRETDEIERKGARAAACRCCCATKVAAPPSLVMADGDVGPEATEQRDKETERDSEVGRGKEKPRARRIENWRTKETAGRGGGAAGSAAAVGRF